MGRGAVVTSNQEQNDSVFRILTCFCEKGWESSWKKMLARRVLGGCSNTRNSQEVLRLIPCRFMERYRPEEKKRTKRWVRRSRESETYKVSSVVSQVYL